MDFNEWKPIYFQILSDFSFEQVNDEKAASILKRMIETKKMVSINDLNELLNNKVVNVFGAGPSLSKDIKAFKKESNKEQIIIAADGATSTLIKNGLIPDIIVTDLDGYIPDQIKANNMGAILIIHAHSDNVPAMKEWVPRFEGKVLATTQSVPDEEHNLYNFGGFTDGDRAVFLASHFNARLINLISFDFNKVGNNSFKYSSKTKLRKLTWANLLIGMIKEPNIFFKKLE